MFHERKGHFIFNPVPDLQTPWWGIERKNRARVELREPVSQTRLLHIHANKLSTNLEEEMNRYLLMAEK